MTKQTINLGSTPNDGTGDPLRSSFGKTNDNFNEIYSTFGDGSTLSGIATSAGIANYANNAGITSHAQGIIGAPDLNVGIVTANGFISAAGVTPVEITHTLTTLTFTVAGIGSTNLTLS
jgi:hypothetical protein